MSLSYQDLMASPGMSEWFYSSDNRRRSLYVRIMETEAGMSGSPKFDRVLAVSTVRNSVTGIMIRVRLVHKKSGVYQINRYIYDCHNKRPFGRGGVMVQFESNDRDQAIADFESRFNRIITKFQNVRSVTV